MKRTLLRLALPLSLLTCFFACPGAEERKDVKAMHGETGTLFTPNENEGDKIREETRKAAQSLRIAERLKTYKNEPAELLYERGREHESAQDYKDAADAFTALVVHHPDHKLAGKATHNAMLNRLRLNEVGEALFIGEDAVTTLGDTRARLRVRRVLGNSYLTVAHWGSERGGEVVRGQWIGNKQVNLYRADRKRAIAHLEEARLEAAPLFKNKSIDAEEHNALLNDLISAVVRFTPYDGSWNYWWYGWQASADDDRVEEEGEDEQVGKRGRRYYGWNYLLQQAKPKGLEVRQDGSIVFEQKPEAYSPELEDTQKLKFLLAELEDINRTRPDDAAQALMRKALIFRTRDGTERLNRLENYWFGGSNPFKKDVQGQDLTALKDDQVIGLVATHLQVFEVPDDENFLKLTAELINKYPNTALSEEAFHLRAQYYQSRKQYDKARDIYRKHIARKDGDAKNAHRRSSKSQLEQLDRAEAAIVDMGAQAAGTFGKLNVKFRNLKKARFEVREVDRALVLRDFKKRHKNGNIIKYDRRHIDPNNLGYMLYHADEQTLDRYAKTKLKDFTRDLEPDPSGLYLTQTVTTPIKKSGLYYVRVFDGDRNLGRGLLLLEKIAAVKKDDDKGPLVWVVDALKGTPLKNASVENFYYWQEYRDRKSYAKSKSEKTRSDADGLARFAPNKRGHSTITTIKVGDTVAYSGFYYGWSGYQRRASSETVALVTTDRPVYRPNHTVEMKVWAREKNEGVYKPATDVKRIEVRVRDPQGNELLNKTQPAGEFGSVALSLNLKDDAALGLYQIQVRADGVYTNAGGASFRVEEYKAPEFTVEVKSEDSARLGETVNAVVKADYLFGGAVAGAKVTYKVYRQDHQHQYKAPRAWDWLYGIGYGRCYYHYSWFAWWPEYYPNDFVWYPWWGPRPEAAKELVKEGEARLDEKGELKIAIDTAEMKKALGKTDHKYTVKAEVVDLSRRLIKGEGSILVTRDAYFAHIETERPWSSAGESVTLVVAAQKPDGSLLATSGKVIVERVAYQGDVVQNDGTGMITEKKIATLKVKTDTLGPARVSYKAPSTGQYKFTFLSKDKKGNEVRAYTTTWIAGPQFHGRKFAFKGLEIHTDKRSYKRGETAQLLINVNREDAAVLLSVRAKNGVLLKPRVIRVKGKSTIVPVKIIEGDVPNFFVEATSVSNAELHQEMREIFVPPQKSTLNVEVTGAKEKYAPGESVELTVRTTDDQNQPVAADVALSVFDKAVLYIQSDLTPNIRKHFWSRKNAHNIRSVSNLSIRFNMGNSLSSPHQQAANQLVYAGTRLLQQEQNYRYNTSALMRGGDAFGADDPARNKNEAKEDSKDMDHGSRISAQTTSEVSKRKSKRAPSAKAAASPDMDMANDESEAAPAEAPEGATIGLGASRESKMGGKGSRKEGPNKKPAVRKKFKGTAHFASSVRTGSDGVAKVRFTLPDNLTTWNVKAIGMAADARAGQSESSFKTSKDILVRLQSPRFFRERDRVVLSAVVRNSSDKLQKVKVTIDVSSELEIEGKREETVMVKPGGDARVDFWANVKHEGQARVRMDALSSLDSDAQEQRFPVLVHGLTKTVSKTGSIAFGKGTAEQTMTLDIPKERREELSSLKVNISPTLSGAMLEALPYLLEYPYGCTEQTLSRFVPAVLTRKSLQQAGGLSLEDLKKLTNLNPQELRQMDAKERSRAEERFKRYNRSPVFNSKKLDDMISSGVKRLASMQNGDGGFGWWGRDGSSRYTTAHVVDALLDAQAADLPLPSGMLSRAKSALANLVTQDLWRYKRYENWVSNEDAYAIYVMSRYGQKNDELADFVFTRRQSLSTYGKVLAAMAFKQLNREARGQTLLQNAEQLLKIDDENETAWLETQQDGWWYWYNNDIETNALYVRALDLFSTSKTANKKRKGRSVRVIKWLLNNRKHGYYWNGTRDTARVVAAFANHMKVQKVRDTDADIDILLDGKVIKSVHIDKKNLFTFDGALELSGKELTSGKHKLTFRRKGKGALFFNSYLSYFTTEEDVKGTGLEIKVTRDYYKLVRDDRTIKSQGDRGQVRKAKQVAYRKVALQNGATVRSGDLILVELMLESKNDYTFLAFEDPKPAGFEPVALKSGSTYGETVANMELRDEKVAFFLRTLARGKTQLTYRLRAEIPGEFHSMPTSGYGMYAPELQTISDEMRFTILDAEE